MVCSVPSEIAGDVFCVRAMNDLVWPFPIARGPINVNILFTNDDFRHTSNRAIVCISAHCGLNCSRNLDRLNSTAYIHNMQIYAYMPIRYTYICSNVAYICTFIRRFASRLIHKKKWLSSYRELRTCRGNNSIYIHYTCCSTHSQQ